MKYIQQYLVIYNLEENMINKKTVSAIILVAGNSTRFGQNRNKNFEDINGKRD